MDLLTRKEVKYNMRVKNIPKALTASHGAYSKSFRGSILRDNSASGVIKNCNKVSVFGKNNSS